MQYRVISCLERASLGFGDKVSLIDGDARFTYREAHDRVNQLANGLKSIGVGEGDAVAALCMNHHRYFEIIFACHAMGAIVVPLNIRLGLEELLYIMNDSKTKVLFIDEPFLPMLEGLRSGARQLEGIYFSDSGETPEGLPNYNELLNGQSTEFESIEIGEDEVAGYYYTGGTTGEPKGVMLTGRNLVSNALHLQSVMQYNPEDVYLHIAPMFHLADLASFYSVTMMGGTHVFGRAFDPKLTCELIEAHKVTVLILVPTMVNIVVNFPDIEKYDLSSLRNFIYGASPMPVPLLREAMEKIPAIPLQGYGMTEAAPLVTTLSAEDHQRAAADPELEWILGTAGRVIPGVEIKIVDEKGDEVAIGEAGEIIVRAPNVMKGYLNKPEATAEAIRNGWYHSSDVAVRNKDGYITIVDRMKDMIISGGENIYTTEVENVLMRFTGILEATVIGVPDPKWGEVVKAFVVMKPGETATDKEIIEFCRRDLAHFKCPKSVDFMEELPKSGAGKILKRDLRKPFWGEGRQVG